MADSDKSVMKVNIAASDRPIWSGEAAYVVVPATNGAMGILPDHEPILSLLTEGKLVVTEPSGNKHSFLVRDGFVSFDSNTVTVAVEHSSQEEYGFPEEADGSPKGKA